MGPAMDIFVEALLIPGLSEPLERLNPYSDEVHSHLRWAVKVIVIRDRSKLPIAIEHPCDMSFDRKQPQGTRSQHLRFIIETELETDGRRIAEISQVPDSLFP
jgi:hypothetical protein